MTRFVSKLVAVTFAALIASATGYVHGVDLEKLPDLSAVQDKTRGIGDDERDAYFQLLDHAAHGNAETQWAEAEQNLREFQKRFYENQNRARAKDPSLPQYAFSLYADLLKKPQIYRGQLLPLEGHIRRLEKMPLLDGDEDLGTAYQTYLFTDDSRTHPYIIVCREVPPGMPQGGDVQEDVAVAGYFFKIYAYDAQDAARIAPLLLAKRLEWFPRQPAEPIIPPLWGGIAATAVLLILVAVIWRIAAKDRHVRRERLRKMADSAEPFSPPEG